MKKSWKKYGRILSILMAAAVLMLPSAPVRAAAGGDLSLRDLRGEGSWPSAPEIVGQSAFLLEANSGMVLFGKNENETRYPASITKVMTSLVVLENANLQDEVTFSHNAIYDIEDGGHNWSFTEGEVLTVEECLYALLLESVNECGYALAEHVAGSVEAFAGMMNEKAAALGCTNTHFNNPHGLNDESHTTTAHDMALIFWAALQNEDFYRIDSATSYTIPAVEGKTTGHSLTMHHKMMLSGSEYYYDGVKAGKTGYTSVAKNTLVTYAERDGMQLVCVVMKSDGGGVVYSDTKKLLDYGFENFQFKDMTAVTQNFCRGISVGYPFPLTVEGSSAVMLPEGVDALTMDFVRSQDGGNGMVGSLEFSSNGQKLASSSLRVLSAEELEQSASQVSFGSGADGEGSAAVGESPAEGTSAQETFGTGETIPADETSGAEESTSANESSDAAENGMAESEPRLVVGEPEESGHSIFFWILVVLGALIGAVALYWCVIQLIKQHRRRKRRRNRARRRSQMPPQQRRR